jgi:hypothetical protein
MDRGHHFIAGAQQWGLYGLFTLMNS